MTDCWPFLAYQFKRGAGAYDNGGTIYRSYEHWIRRIHWVSYWLIVAMIGMEDYMVSYGAVPARRSLRDKHDKLRLDEVDVTVTRTVAKSEPVKCGKSLLRVIQSSSRHKAHLILLHIGTRSCNRAHLCNNTVREPLKSFSGHLARSPAPHRAFADNPSGTRSRPSRPHASAASTSDPP